MVNTQNLTLPSGSAKIGSREHNVQLNASTQTVDALNNLAICKSGDAVIYIRAVAHVRDGYIPQTNIVRHNGKLQRRRLLAGVSLLRALGGGWESTDAPKASTGMHD